MLQHILTGGVAVAALAGAGGTALAAAHPATPGATASSSSSAPQHAKAGAGGDGHHSGDRHGARSRLLRHLEHAQIVTHRKSGEVTHDLIRGTVRAVSSTSITVVAPDRTTETFAVTKDTSAHTRKDGKRVVVSLAGLHTGDSVRVAGVGADAPVAKHISLRVTH